jgi:hypothetical protein
LALILTTIITAPPHIDNVRIAATIIAHNRSVGGRTSWRLLQTPKGITVALLRINHVCVAAVTFVALIAWARIKERTSNVRAALAIFAVLTGTRINCRFNNAHTVSATFALLIGAHIKGL